MPTVISIANEKGGVGKTTTARNIGAGLAKVGKRVLEIDLDQQCNLSDYHGFDFKVTTTIAEVIYAEVANQPIDYSSAVKTNDDGVDYIPASKMLATTTSILSNDNDSQTVLRRVLSHDFFNQYDYIIIDCRPSLDLLVVNALVASDQLIIPIQAEKFSLDGVSAIMNSYKRVKSTQNPTLEIGGMLITMYNRTNLAKEIEQLLREDYGNLVFQTVIPRLSEASNSTCNQKSLVDTKNSRLGEKYMAVVEEILNGKL